MRSQLTRRVFQHILRNEPFLHKGHIRRIHSATTRPCLPYIRRQIPQISRRSLWWLLPEQKAGPRIPKPKKLDPGFEILDEQKFVLDQGFRKYSNAEVLGALRQFVRHKEDVKKSVLDSQIQAVLATYKYLLSEREFEPELQLTVEETATALRRLKGGQLFAASETPDANVDAFVSLADLLFEDIKKRESEWPTAIQVEQEPGNEDVPEQEATPFDDVKLAFFRKCTQSYISVLAFRLKDGVHVRDVFVQLAKDYPSFATITTFSKVVVWALSYSAQKDELDMFSKWIHSTFNRLPPSIWTGIIQGAVASKNLQRIQEWWPKRPDNIAHSNIVGAEIAVLQLCIKLGSMEWGQPILNRLVEAKFKQESLRGDQMIMILTWAMASGKDVDELEDMLDLLCSRLEIPFRTQDVNQLLEMAKIKNDAYYAERLFSLARKKGVEFDAGTYKLEIEWRLIANDVAGARISYNRLLNQDFEAEDLSPITNKLALAMAAKTPLPHKELMNVVDELAEQQGSFSAELVSVLCKLHLERAELHDLADLLHTHLGSLNLAGRVLVRSTIVDYISQAETAGEKWDGYTVLRSLFPETNREIRLRIVQEFFKVKRHDLATQVFGHMRGSYNRALRPDSAAYAMFFESLAFVRRVRPFDFGHNMLRLDVDVEPDTAIKTAMMLAYTTCDLGYRALMVWDEVAYSREGPTFDTVNIALRACQDAPDGPKYGRNIWKQLLEQEIDIPKETIDSYIAALSSWGELDAAIEVVKGMEQLSGGAYKADILSILALMNRSKGDQNVRSQLWVQEHYPAMYKQATAAGLSPFKTHFLVEPHLPPQSPQSPQSLQSLQSPHLPQPTASSSSAAAAVDDIKTGEPNGKSSTGENGSLQNGSLGPGNGGSGAYKARWAILGKLAWELEYIDWKKVQQRVEETGVYPSED